MPATATPSAKRLKLAIRGGVQGVGFRPFIFRLATELGLSGWVNNSAQGVFVEVEGAPAELEQFLLRLEPEKPPRSFIQSAEASWLDPAGHERFEIRESEAGGAKTALVLPDIATCPDCLREIFDAENRRHFYPFTNCTHCGPRFSIIEGLPYDRANTSMRQFSMCARCQAEYDNPRDRRFHAQPNACPDCGPRLELRDARGNVLGHDPLSGAADAIRTGKIVGVKGLGGFHLMVAAHDERAVQRLRQLKHREEKPFALMFPSLEAVKQVCEVSPLEERLLRSPEAPIVLLARAHSRITHHASLITIPDAVAPQNPLLGVMLPYTPLHHLLMSLLRFPVVATSGNLSDEPICTDERDAVERLGGIADVFLVHNRPIVRHVDDSIVRVMMGREMVLRRARGYAPLPITHNPQPTTHNPSPILAVGAHLKNSVALAVGSQAFISQHIGDLETDQAFAAFRRVAEDLQRLYDSPAATVVSDLHPDYLSTKWAEERVSEGAGLRAVSVQHHVAHVLSCMAENELTAPALGVSWDGTGYGLDGTIWGGEFFLVTDAGCERAAHFRRFRLPGGDKAVREPRRAALGMLHELFGDAAFDLRHLPPLRGMPHKELATLKSMLERGLNSPLTSSAGRLFDAVASLAGLRQHTRFEGQAAMELEFAIDGFETDEHYAFDIVTPASGAGPLLIDWAPMMRELLDDINARVSVAELSAKFHNGLVEAIVAVALRSGEERVVLSGGCFQNRYLTERAVRRLEEENFRPYWHQRVPPNDGGIALGQIAAALREKV
jgi:hydrogenase maturation protein HypF